MEEKSDDRARPTEATVNAILTKCNRVCALCWAFSRDGRAKHQGQLAHIERKSSKSQEEDLAWLCLSCHDLYDSRPSQSKRLQPKELKHYKERVEELVSGGTLPTFDSSNGALVAVDVEHACIVPFDNGSQIFEAWCIFSNAGERATGIKRVRLSRENRQWGEIGYLGDEKTCKAPYFHSDASYLRLNSDQVVEPGRACWWVVNFFIPLENAFSEAETGLELKFDPTIYVEIEPVIGSRIVLEIGSAKVQDRLAAWRGH